MPFGFTIPPASAAETATMRIALTSNTTTDRREFDVPVDAEPVIIGRASRTRGKQLEAQSDNALFDCPVISRLHAELRASSRPPYVQQVTISDSSSLHGTKVNGLPLQPNSRFVLKPGDVINLGDRVTRGDGTHSLLLLPSYNILSRSANIPLDAHEGISLTFERLNTTFSNYMSSTADLQPSNTLRGFRAPSFSDASDMDSDHAGSYISDGEHHPSSAKTTPEQNKMKFGTQKAPIPLDDDLSEDVTFSLRVPESDVRPALNSTQHTDFDSFSDAASLQDMGFGSNNIFSAEDGLSDAGSEEDSEIDDVDIAEYDDFEEEDDISDVASDVSSEEASDVNDEEDEEEEEEEEEQAAADDEEPSYRAPSPELGTFNDVSEATTTLADIAGVSRSRWDSPAKRYDPVRSSVAAVDQAPQVPEPHHQAGRTLITPFTYDYPGYDARLATNFPPSSHWDVQHPVYPTSYSQPAHSLYDQGFYRMPTLQHPLFPMSIDAIVEPPVMENGETPIKPAEDTVSNVAVAEPSSTEVVAEATAECSSKRKRDEADEVVEASQPPAKKTTQTPPAPPARRRLSPKKDRSTIRKAVVGITQAAACVTVGAVGTVAFLSSPMAESLIQWLG